MTGKRHGRVPAFADLEGVWRSRGYGYVLSIDGDGYVLYEETAISCLPIAWGPLRELSERYVELRVSPAAEAFDVRRATGVSRIGFRRLARLPTHCVEPETERRLDPEFNFEVFWHTFAEQYALFDIKAVDWQAAYEVYRPRVGANMPAETLFATMAAMLRPLLDGHVRLHSPYGRFDAGPSPTLYQRLDLELDEAGDARSAPVYLQELREAAREIIRDDYLQGRPRKTCRGLLEWGRLRGGAAGYLAVRAMAGQSGKLGEPLADVEAADAAMLRILDEIGHLPALILDLRGNGGGFDNVALRIAAHLIDRRRMAFVKSVRHGAGITGGQRVFVEPAGQARYEGRLILLTSELTASAAEIFVLALLQHPRCTRMGEPTEGILSDFLERHLPNGWSLTLSNEIYRAADGKVYEDCGIPPHVSLPFLSRADREAGRDGMLDAALAELAGE